MEPIAIEQMKRRLADVPEGRLLRDTGQGVAQVARAVGCDSASKFSAE